METTHKAYLQRLTVASETFILTSPVDTVRIKLACARAVRGGGNVVAVPTMRGQRFDVLITPGQSVFIETIELDPAPEDDDEDAMAGWDYLGV
jgi:hypothetical protein